MVVWSATFVWLICVVCLCFFLRMSTKSGGALFRIGYFFYSKTRLGYYYHLKNIDKAKSAFADGHSITSQYEYAGLKIVPIAIVEDNYSYLIIDQQSNIAVVVDPADAGVIQSVIDNEGVPLKAILTTHKHWDHSGGNSELKRNHPDLLVYGSSFDSVPALTNNVIDGDIITLGKLQFTARFTPGHTVGHTVYYLNGTPFESPGHIFTGDLLFLAGTGRVFESSASVMLRSLDVILEFPNNTLMWPGHEYAQDNLTFVQHIDPDNKKAKDKLQWVKEQRLEKKMTIPSTLEEEKEYNPFLRTHCQLILEILGLHTEEEVDKNVVRAKALKLLRIQKDNFSYKL